jgi:choice-of-anchor C domain-containing protein
MLMRRRTLSSVVVAVVLAATVAGTTMAADVDNGGFEDGTYTGNPATFQPLLAGATNVASWTIGGNGIDWIWGLWEPQAGTKSVDLSRAAAGSVSQSVDTVPGRTYLVLFWLAGNPDGGPTVKTLDVTAGSTAKSYSFDTTGHGRTDMGWVRKSLAFKATAPSTTLTFGSTVNTFFGPALDSVSVTKMSPRAPLCKRGGWRELTDNDDRPFRNQGDCVSYFASGLRNKASG